LRTLLFISLLSFKLLSEAQSPLSFIQSERTDRLDPQITSQRSLVIISTPKKDDKWKTYARYVHKAFRVMGVDAVNYMHYLDYNASPVVKQANDSYASRRQIKFYIVIEEKGNAFRMAVQNQSSTTDEAWYSEADDLRQLILNLAVTLKRIEHANQNFLIAVEPEYLSSLSMFEGTRYQTYPTRIKRMKMAIMELPKIAIDGMEGTQQRAEIEEYNLEIEEKNQIITRGIEKYPHKLDLVPIQPEKDLYRQGYQYVIYYLRSSAESIRNILAYESTSQPEYISQLTLEDGKRSLITYSSDETLYKWYIKQTVISDLHVGRYWDAHEDFENSFEHFINRLNTILR
jgi:hypothetical protein